MNKNAKNVSTIMTKKARSIDGEELNVVLGGRP
jgi:hypothetical protein